MIEQPIRMEGWGDTSGDEGSSPLDLVPRSSRGAGNGERAGRAPKSVDAEPGERGKAPGSAAATRKSPARGGTAAAAGGGSVAAMSRLHGGYAERNRKLEEKKREIERQKVAAEEASMQQWDTGRKKKPKKAKSPSRTKSAAAETGGGDGGARSSAAATQEPALAAAAVPRQQSAAATAVTSPAAPVGAEPVGAEPATPRQGSFALPDDVTQREMDVFVEAVRGYQGLPTPTVSAASTPPLSATASTTSDAADRTGGSPSLEALISSSGVEEKVLTITELPGPDELQSETRPPAEPVAAAEEQETPPSPLSLSDIARAVGDAREADAESDRRTALLMHQEAVRVYQGAARRRPATTRWPSDLQAELAEVEVRTGALKREVAEQGQKRREGGQQNKQGGGGGGLFSCCGSRAASANGGSPEKPARPGPRVREASAEAALAEAAASSERAAAAAQSAGRRGFAGRGGLCAAYRPSGDTAKWRRFAGGRCVVVRVQRHDRARAAAVCCSKCHCIGRGRRRGGPLPSARLFVGYPGATQAYSSYSSCYAFLGLDL